MAVCLVGAPALAAVFITGQRGSVDRAVEEMTAATGVTSRSVAQIASASAGRGMVVSSAQDLRRALEDAGDGAVILLAAGRYPEISIGNINKAGTVTVASADSSSPAVIGKLLIRNSSGLLLRDLELAADASAAVTEAGGDEAGGQDGLSQQQRREQWMERRKAMAERRVQGMAQGGDQSQNARRGGGGGNRFPFMVLNSERITLDKLYVHGPLDNQAAAFRIPAMMIRSSRQITISNSRFSTLWHGLAMLDLDGMTVRNNEFSDIRTDGVRGGDVSNIEITGNVFTDFRPAPGDHPDGIQLWSTPKGMALRNIIIRDNMVVRGKGQPTQGIFLRDVKNGLTFHNVEIRGNLVMGGLYNGIAVNGVEGGTIEDNHVVNYSDRPRSWIRIDNSRDVAMKQNQASHFIVSRSQVEQSNNKVDGRGKIDEARDVAQWLDAKPGRRRTDSRLQGRLVVPAGS